MPDSLKPNFTWTIILQKWVLLPVALIFDLIVMFIEEILYDMYGKISLHENLKEKLSKNYSNFIKTIANLYEHF